MNRIQFITACAIAAIATTANAGIIVTVEDAGQLHSTQAGVTEVNFNDNTKGAYVSITGSGGGYHIVSDSSSGLYATPFGFASDDPYLSVPDSASSGAAAVSLDGHYNYFGMFWGSVDSYNFIEFFDNGNSVGSFGGADITSLIADGNQTDTDSNRYVNFFFTGADSFNSFIMSSTSYAFETDNHAYGNVPEPSSLALLGLGLAGLGFSRRKSNKA